jgi:pimeloyl-ACP methyl ester carboxylesterase
MGHPQGNTMHKFKFILIGIVLFFAIATAGFLAWANTPLGPMPEALEALQPDADVQVTEEGWIVFQPPGTQADTGLILYPGGRVDPRAYAPIARAIAEQGYLVVIVPMPLNLAVLGAERAQDVIAAYPEIEHWAIGGHSLGGAMAARFAYQHPGLIQGLALWAAYPASSDDLSGQSLDVLSIVGSEDGLGTDEGVEETRQLLPDSTQFIVIAGGNHAQFGWYGDQSGDNPAIISRSEQQSQILDATLALLEGLK